MRGGDQVPDQAEWTIGDYLARSVVDGVRGIPRAANLQMNVPSRVSASVQVGQRLPNEDAERLGWPVTASANDRGP